jgi:molybdate transport system ATP-binding protein
MLEVSLTHNFKKFHIDLSFGAENGSITGLFGRSGSGKTSIINMISGLTKPDRGYVRIGDQVILDTKKNIFVPPEQRHLGYVFQDNRLFPHLTVRGNLVYGLNNTINSSQEITFERVINVLEISKLLERKPANLSGGEKQRVAIGRAVLTQPSLLLMDEPLASIDVQLRNEILQFIEELRNELGLTIIYVSHAIDEVIRLADQMVLISNGTKKAEGKVEDIMSRLDLAPLTGRFDAGAVLSTKVHSYDKKYGLTELSFNGGVLRITGTNLPIGQTVKAHIKARDVSLTLKHPNETSILNIFEGSIIEVGNNQGPQVDIKIDIGSPLIARITRKSFDELGLSVGTSVFTMLKAVAIDRRNLGGDS